jgi:Tol biopolymer transport system component
VVKLNPVVPVQLDDVVRKALEKDRNVRYQSAAEIGADLKRLKRDLDSAEARSVAVDSGRRLPRKLVTTIVLALMATAAVVLIATLWPGALHTLRQRTLVQRELTANPSENPVYAAAISPDGRYLAFADFTGVFLKTLETGETHSLKLPEGFCFRCVSLSWFRDGTKLIGVGPGQSGNTTGIWYISIFGEPPRKLRDDAGRASVSPDGRQIAFISGRQQAEIWIMGSDGQDPKRVAEAGVDGRFLQVQWSPDGRRLAFMKSVGQVGERRISLESLDPIHEGAVQMFSSPGLQSFCWTADGELFLALQEPAPNQSDTNLWQSKVRPSGKLESAPKQITKWIGFSFWDLSATADGTRVAFVKSGSQADVYVGKLDQRKRQLAEVHRLTLNEHDDWPSGWTSDGEVLFYSDRNGHFDIFRQRPGAPQPTEVLSSAEDKVKPEVSSDGKWLLYWQSSLQQGQTKHLMTMNVESGAVSPVLETQPGTEFHCAGLRPLCVLAEPDVSRKQAVFSRFAIGTGVKTQLGRVSWSGSGNLVWSLNADASVIALADTQQRGTVIRTFALLEQKMHEYNLDQIAVTGIAAAGNEWLLTSSSLHGNELLRLSHAGTVQHLWSSSSPISAPVTSNVGQMVAIGLLSQESNAWLLEQK